MTALRAAIAGLGRVGMLFDEDKKRRSVWTHFGAYEHLPDRFELIAACDPDPVRRRQAGKRRASLRTYESLDELLRAEEVDVISLCTPVELHASQLRACAGRVRGVMCEKPLSANAADGEAALGVCVAEGTTVAVNYYKRFEQTVQQAARLLLDRAAGDVRSATAVYAGGLEAVGSHAVDLLTFLLGPLTVSHVDPAGGGTTLTFGDHGLAAVLVTGRPSDLIFEIDLIGCEGRIRIVENCARLEFSRFGTSSRYSGYRELHEASLEPEPIVDPFLAHFGELADVLEGIRPRLTSDAAGALHAQRVLDRMRNDAV